MSAVEPLPAPWIPEDTFALRLMAVRQRAGWTNVAKGAKACDIDAQTWRNWETGDVLPRDYIGTCRKIAGKAGCDPDWLALGGDLARSRCSSVFTLLTGGGEGEGEHLFDPDTMQVPAADPPTLTIVRG